MFWCECCGADDPDNLPYLVDENAEVYLCTKCANDLKSHVTVEPLEV